MIEQEYCTCAAGRHLKFLSSHRPTEGSNYSYSIACSKCGGLGVIWKTSPTVNKTVHQDFQLTDSTTKR